MTVTEVPDPQQPARRQSVPSAREELLAALDNSHPPYGKKDPGALRNFAGMKDRLLRLERAIDALIVERLRLPIEQLEVLRLKVDRLYLGAVMLPEIVIEGIPGAWLWGTTTTRVSRRLSRGLKRTIRTLPRRQENRDDVPSKHCAVKIPDPTPWHTKRARQLTGRAAPRSK